MKKRTLIFIIVLIIVVLTTAVLGTYLYIRKQTKVTQERLLEIANTIVNLPSKNELEENSQNQTITKEELEINEDVIGILKIPKLNMEAPIKEGTTQSALKYAIGHFQNSSFWNGNVALAAHNQGIYSNYFKKINTLEKGDEIIYTTEFGKREYKVNQIKEINSTDWSVISNTEENIITLITCIKNQDKKRLCVTGNSV